MVNSRGTMSKTQLGEWFWRFLAFAMMVSVGWTVWIIYQLNPPPLVKAAAFEAAAKAKVKGTHGEQQSAKGMISPSAAAKAAPPAMAEASPAPTAPEAPKVPPINPEKLKLSETLALPEPTLKK